MPKSNTPIKVLSSTVVILIAAGCSKPTKQGREMADGLAQLRRGMTTSEVSSAVGSPTSKAATLEQTGGMVTKVLGNVGVRSSQ